MHLPPHPQFRMLILFSCSFISVNFFSLPLEGVAVIQGGSDLTFRLLICLKDATQTSLGTIHPSDICAASYIDSVWSKLEGGMDTEGGSSSAKQKHSSSSLLISSSVFAPSLFADFHGFWGNEMDGRTIIALPGGSGEVCVLSAVPLTLSFILFFVLHGYPTAAVKEGEQQDV